MYPPCTNPRVDGLLPARVRVRVELWAPAGVPVLLPKCDRVAHIGNTPGYSGLWVSRGWKCWARGERTLMGSKLTRSAARTSKEVEEGSTPSLEAYETRCS